MHRLDSNGEKILTDTQEKFPNALLVPFIQPVITAYNISRQKLISQLLQ